MNKLRSLSYKVAIVTTVFSLIAWLISAINPGQGYGNLAIWLVASSALFITPYTNLPKESSEDLSRGKLDYLMDGAVAAFYATVLAIVVYIAIPYFPLAESSGSINAIEGYGLLVLAIALLTSFSIHVFAALRYVTYLFRTVE